MDKYTILSDDELKLISGGELIITGATIYAGVKLAAASFTLGYGIGQAVKYSK